MFGLVVGVDNREWCDGSKIVTLLMFKGGRLAEINGSIYKRARAPGVGN